METPPGETVVTVLASEPLLAAVPADRVDRWLATVLANPSPGGPAVPEPPSRSRLKSLILEGRLTQDGEPLADPAEKVRPGRRFTLHLPAPEPAEPAPQAIPLAVVHEDAHLIVVDKPPGMVVHPAPGNPDRTLVNALLAHCGSSLTGIGGVQRPGIVHRLDKDTSGLLVAAKTAATHAALVRLFAAHDLDRAYLALVWGRPSPPAGRIASSIGRSPHNRKKMAVVARGGRQAVTRYRVLRSYGNGAVSLVECRLQTGRTHQIRVHMAHIGHPVVGDRLYGRPRRTPELPAELARAIACFPRQALHAAELGLVHPATGRRLEFRSGPPPDMAGMLLALDAARDRQHV